MATKKSTPTANQREDRTTTPKVTPTPTPTFTYGLGNPAETRITKPGQALPTTTKKAPVRTEKTTPKTEVVPPAGGYTVVQPGGRVQVKANNIVRFTGFIQDWEFSFDDAGFDGKATLTALDRMYRVGNAVFTGGQAWQVEPTTDRMKTVLNYNGFGAAEYSQITSGQTLLGYDDWNAGDSVLSYLQQVARSEPGDFYSNASAVMTFTSYGCEVKQVSQTGQVGKCLPLAIRILILQR